MSDAVSSVVERVRKVLADNARDEPGRRWLRAGFVADLEALLELADAVVALDAALDEGLRNPTAEALLAELESLKRLVKATWAVTRAR